MPWDVLLKGLGRYARAVHVGRLVAGAVILLEVWVLHSHTSVNGLRLRLSALFDSYTIAGAVSLRSIVVVVFVAFVAYVVGLLGEHTTRWITGAVLSFVVRLAARVHLLRQGRREHAEVDELLWSHWSESLWYQVLLGPAPNARFLWRSLEYRVGERQLAGVLKRLPMPLEVGESSWKKVSGSVWFTSSWLSRYSPGSQPPTRLLSAPGQAFVPVLLLAWATSATALSALSGVQVLVNLIVLVALLALARRLASSYINGPTTYALACLAAWILAELVADSAPASAGDATPQGVAD